MDKYIHPCWIVNGDPLAARIQNIAMASSLDEISDWKTEVAHYQKLRAIDEKSFSDAITRIRAKVGDGKDFRDERKAIPKIFDHGSSGSAGHVTGGIIGSSTGCRID